MGELAPKSTDTAKRRGSKDGKMAEVAVSIAKLLLRHGPESVTFTRTARAAGVSRAWLYKYLGRDRDDLLRFAAAHFGEILAELDSRPRVTSRDAWIEDTLDGLKVFLGQARQHPWVVPLYFRYAGSQGAVSETIAEIERRYLQTVVVEAQAALSITAEAAQVLAETLQAMRFGLAFRLVTMDADVEEPEALRLMERWLRAAQ